MTCWFSDVEAGRTGVGSVGWMDTGSREQKLIRFIKTQQVRANAVNPCDL